MSVSPLRLVGLAAMGLAVLDIIHRKRITVDYRSLCIVIWLVYGFVSLLWAIDEARFSSYYSIYMNNSLMFLLFATISFTRSEVETLKKSMVFGVGALLLYMTFIPDAVSYSDYQHRLTLNAGTEGLDQNYLAALMLMSFGIVFYDLCNKQLLKKHKILSVVFCATVAYYVFLTGSRSGLIAIILIVLLSINTSYKNRFVIGLPILVLLLFVFPLLSKYVSQDLLERFSLSALTGQEEESAARLLIWEKALTALGGIEVIFGYGTGASQTVIGNTIGGGKDMAIHNHYLAMLVEYGIAGSLMINIPILKMVTALWKKDKGMSVGFIGILLMAFFLDVVTTKFFWSAMILLSICHSATKTHKTCVSNCD